MNLFKKIFFISVFLFSFFVNANAQTEKYIDSYNYFQWIQSNNPGCGVGSFYVYVNKYFNNKNGFYYYEFYVWSNSYYSNCTVSYSFIDDFILYIHNGGDYVPVLKLDYYLAAPKSTSFNGWNYITSVYSSNPNQKFKIKWNGVKSY